MYNFKKFNIMFGFPFENLKPTLYHVTEKENEFEIEVSAPGHTKDTIDVGVENSKLIIETIDDKFEQSTFVKPFKIVFDVSKFDTDEITAKVKHGILKVTVPKQTKKITKSVKWLNK